MIRALASSLSLRLLGIFLLTAILLIIILTTFFSRGLGSQWKRTIQPHIQQYVLYLQQDIGDPPNPERAQAISDRLPVSIAIYKNKDDGDVEDRVNDRDRDKDRDKGASVGTGRGIGVGADIDADLVYSTSGQEPILDELHFRPISRLEKHLQENTRASIATDRRPQETVLRISRNGYTVFYELRNRTMRSGAQAKAYDHRRWQHLDSLLWALLALALVLIGSYLTIRHQLKPIRKIQHSVGRISDGELDHRINARGSGDLAELSNRVDGMAARIQDMLDAKRQLLMAISHELRSPLARARIAAELLPESTNRQRLEDDLREMQDMITDIMESERLQQNHAVLNLQQLDLAELVHSEVERAGGDISVSVSQPDRMIIDADESRLRILIRNLLNNALLHGKDINGLAQVSVSLEASDAAVILTVSDQGPGIPAEHLASITEPFYRTDASRTRATGGFGLGLTLARLIAEAHGGSLTVDSDPGVVVGTRVVVVVDRAAC